VLRELIDVLTDDRAQEVAIERPDAYVLADTLRTDRARLRPLIPDTPATVALRRVWRARRDLASHRVANQLRAHLRARLPPTTVGPFAELDSPISLLFLTRFTTQDQADWLSPAVSVPGWARSATPATSTRLCCTPA